MMLCHAFIALTIKVAAATFEYPGRATMNDVLEFFKTEQGILLYARSYSRQIEKHDPVCIYNRVKEMNGSLIRLYQRYDYGTQSKHGCFAYGVSYNVSKQPGMDIAPIIEAKKTKERKCSEAAYIENSKGLNDFEEDYKEGRRYLFQYYDATEKCAVITFSDKKYSIKCELHVWYTFYHKDKSNCVREYDYLCGKRPLYQLYKNKLCQWALPKI